jgi:hypothetical protein
MVNCSICREKIGMLSKKHNMKDDKGQSLVYCEDCYYEWEKKQEEKSAKEKKARLDKILSVNTKWEYMVKKIETGFGGNVKTEDDELHRLGKEGWELVGVTAVNQANIVAGQIVTLIMAFKRKIPN